jgi:hypothetical protein
LTGKELHSTEELPAGIFHPSIHDIFVAQIVLKFRMCRATINRVLMPGAPVVGA